jgi:uncharacterized protein (DUF1697 family)
MTDLCAAFETAGCTDVRGYIQSGNVLFDAPDELALQRVVEAVESLIGGPATIIFRSLADLEAIIAANRLREYLHDRALKLYIVFLASEPARELRLPVVDEKECLELVAVNGREAYLVSHRKPSGMYGFPTVFLERELGVSTTARNWSTVTRLLAFAKRDAG